MGLIRVQRDVPAQLTRTFYVGETPTDVTGDVTVTVTRLDGTAVVSGVAAHPGPAGQYTFAVPAQARLDALVVDWSGSLGRYRDLLEIVGGHYFDLAEARTEHGLTLAQHPTEKLIRKRLEVEVECERICGQAFVPRFERTVVRGDGRAALLLPRVQVRELRAVTVAGTAWSPADVAAVQVDPSGVLHHRVGWPVGPVVVEYEHGMDMPPEDLRTAAMLRLRSRVHITTSGVPDRAISWSAADGGTYRIALPTGEKTGIPEVDAAYEGNTVDMGGFA
ncbi:hypothetical protein [Micromonospora aurantiaca (nom. illeg.)]|uniref:hypothetical protein n=1 Tax=Micromonospora aurantiaca (nom. illeg.) TaxID=47850 RepID=UPI0011A855B7